MIGCALKFSAAAMSAALVVALATPAARAQGGTAPPASSAPAPRTAPSAKPQAAPASPAAAALAPWQKQAGPNGVFTVEMPGKPGYKLEQAKSGGGTAFVYHSYSLDHDSRAFVVQTATYPADVDVKDPKANLRSALAASEKLLLKKKWDKLTWTTFQGTPAVEATGQMTAELEFRNFLVLKGHQMYSLGYAGPPGTIRSADAERFFKSLRLGR
jgi:hypothetical protein